MSSAYKASRKAAREEKDGAADGRGPYGRSVHLPPPQKVTSSSTSTSVPAPSPSAPGAAPPADAVATLWVGSLQPSVTDDDLFDAFAPYGFVTDVNLTEQRSAAGGPTAFVKYTFRDEAEAALSASLNRQLLVKGKAVMCRWADKDIVSLAQLKSAALSAQQQTPSASPLTSVPVGLNGAQSSVAGCNFIAPKIWIGNLPIGTNEDDLRKVCRGSGAELVDVIIHKKPSQYGQLSGFLRFKTQLETDMMLKAISSGAIMVRGAVMKADWAKGQS